MDLDFTTQALIIQVDQLEQQIQQANQIVKQYDEIKKQLKTKMLEIGKKNNLEQVKWITPNGTTITCSVGKKPVWKEEIKSEFNLDVLKKEYPEIYQKCFTDQRHNILVEAGSNDILRITSKKVKKDE